MPLATLKDWVKTVAAHTKPAAIRWCDGTALEARSLEDRLVGDGTLTRLNEQEFPRSFLHRSHPTDVARTEHLTFICSEKAEDAGPLNNWLSRADADGAVWPLFAGSMRGRTMYVVPYLMGPPGSSHSRVGVQITDSGYVALNLRLMTRVGDVALRHLVQTKRFVKGIHSLGDLSPERRFVLHFPSEKTIWSIGSGYGSNALLSKECHALRIASVEARDEGWLAEHMMVVGLTSPEGVKHYIAAAFPSACGKTNLAMLVPTLPGWRVETVGDDICWLHVGDDGRLWAINPEAGFFGVAPGTGPSTNPNAMAALTRDVIFTNVALRENGTPWWTSMRPLADREVLTDWRGHRWTEASPGPAAHPNSRFTVAAKQCPTVGPSLDNPRGVPISAIVFGGRRAHVAPLVYEARDWEHGVYVGATLVSETTAAATGEVGIPRNDPMAMLPFCGYNMADYFGHWLTVGRRLTNPPKIFHVNWFRRDQSGKLLWPGFGDNVRVIKWMLGRVAGTAAARATAIGSVPFDHWALDTRGMSLDAERIQELLSIDSGAWLEEVARNEAFLGLFGARLPRELMAQHEALRARLHAGLS